MSTNYDGVSNSFILEVRKDIKLLLYKNVTVWEFTKKKWRNEQGVSHNSIKRNIANILNVNITGNNLLIVKNIKKKETTHLINKLTKKKRDLSLSTINCQNCKMKHGVIRIF